VWPFKIKKVKISEQKIGQAIQMTCMYMLNRAVDHPLNIPLYFMRLDTTVMNDSEKILYENTLEQVKQIRKEINNVAV
jgi:hypothetical protein